MFYCEEHHFTFFPHLTAIATAAGEKNNKSERVSGIVQGAGPNGEASRIRPAGRSLGTTGLHIASCMILFLGNFFSVKDVFIQPIIKLGGA